jgi:hypothetical protein
MLLRGLLTVIRATVGARHTPIYLPLNFLQTLHKRLLLTYISYKYDEYLTIPTLKTLGLSIYFLMLFLRVGGFFMYLLASIF